VISRRTLLTGSLVAGSALLGPRVFAQDRAADFEKKLAQLEQRHGGRLGVAILDTSKAKPLAYRGDERFPLCSTFKVLAAAYVLARVDRKEESLDRRVMYAKKDLVTYSPTTEKHADADGMTIAEICEAAITLSDNTAGNLMLASFGGPEGLTKYLRSMGDNVTRLDRWETELNEAAPGDPRDTTSPLAMLETLRKLLVVDALSASSREQLIAWMVDCKTGDKRLRAGVPPGWRVGDKTGTGEHNATNDVAIIWPPNRAPVLVTAYYVDANASGDDRSAVIAEIGRIATASA
jgi:beta-lactamase class A